MHITIDGQKANALENMSYRGLGMVSGNNSSRLLLDYKAEHPEAYYEILSKIFGEEGLGICHLKLEMGADINSSSGTEPCVKRRKNERADVTRGAGYQIASDAKKINPRLTLDLLWWSEPAWVTKAENVYEARYQWYKETLEAAYVTYGLKFDYVSAVRNEREIDVEWVKYLSQHLKAEKDSCYDYSEINIVGGDEDCRWEFADSMLVDEELLQSVDVVGSHYTSQSSDNAKKLAKEYGKELWFSEGSPPMSYAQGICHYESGAGLGGTNGVLEIANRIIAMYAQGAMTLYEFQPVVSAYYDGVTYCHKQLITADEPWSGKYFLDSGYYMALHFSRFLKKGWRFVDSACYADGKPGGDGHTVIDTTYSYLTAMDEKTGDFSTIIVNATQQAIPYDFSVHHIQKAFSEVSVWETRGSMQDRYDANYFRKTELLFLKQEKDVFTYSVVVKPYSIITVTTLSIKEPDVLDYQKQERTVLALPYSDDFAYRKYSTEYLSSRGYAPRYTTDQGGAFEVREKEGKRSLMQIITEDSKAAEWGKTPEPTTNLGDDCWFNYSVSIDAAFAKSKNSSGNYVGIGLRYCLADNGKSGYWLQLFEDGRWFLKHNDESRAEGRLEEFGCSEWIPMKIEAVENIVRIYIYGKCVCQYVCSGESLSGAGRVAIYSAYENNYFSNLKVKPAGGSGYAICRFDDTDSCVEYSGKWKHELMSSFRDYKRTISMGEKGASAKIYFEGTGIAITGKIEKDCRIAVKFDEEEIQREYRIGAVDSREISYFRYHLEDTSHIVKITVLDGVYTIDSFEVEGSK